MPKLEAIQRLDRDHFLGGYEEYFLSLDLDDEYVVSEEFVSAIGVQALGLDISPDNGDIFNSIYQYFPTNAYRLDKLLENPDDKDMKRRYKKYLQEDFLAELKHDSQPITIDDLPDLSVDEILLITNFLYAKTVLMRAFFLEIFDTKDEAEDEWQRLNVQARKLVDAYRIFETLGNTGALTGMEIYQVWLRGSLKNGNNF